MPCVLFFNERSKRAVDLRLVRGCVRPIGLVLEKPEDVAIKLDVDSNLRFHLFTERFWMSLQESTATSPIGTRLERLIWLHSGANVLIVIFLGHSNRDIF